MRTNLGRHHNDYVFVEYTQRIPSNRIEVRYSKGWRRIKLLSYAVNGDYGCCVSHATTEHMRKVDQIDLWPLLKLEQERQPELPIHVI